jgi:hypothetical protein
MVSVVEGVLREERDRNLEMQRVFQRELAGLPRGSLVIQKIGNNDYCYLKYRENGKLVSRYVGRADQHQAALEAQIVQRKKLEAALRRIKYDLKVISRAVKD